LTASFVKTMAIHKTKSYLLRKIPLRETSWIATCLTRSYGKIKGVIKGARQEKSKWFGSCELFTYSNLIYFSKTRTNLHLITELSLINSHSRLRNYLESIAHASYFAELVDHFLEEGEAHADIFDLFHAAIGALEDQPMSCHLIARTFEIKLLYALGFFPNLTECLGCRGKVFKVIYFSGRQGGIFCESCYEQSQSGFRISHGCAQAMQFLARTDFQRAVTLKLGQQISQELGTAMRQFLDDRFDKQPKSLHFISQLKQTYPAYV